MIQKHPTKRDSEGRPILFHRFMSPPNAKGQKKRLYVQCPPEYNTSTFLKKMEREAIDRWVSGMFTTGDTFAAYVNERFFKEYPASKNLKPSSVSTIRWVLDIALKQIGDVPLGAIDAGVIARMSAHLKTVMVSFKNVGTRRRYSEQTIKTIVITICSVLRWAARLGDISSMPNIQIPRVPRMQRPAPYTPEEVHKLMKATASETERLVFLLLFDAGIRVSELLGLTWEQVDFAKGIVLVDRQIYRGEAAPTKNSEARPIPMSPDLAAALKAYRHLRGPNVFLRPNGRPFSASYVRAMLTRCSQRVGLRRTRVHDGRHAFATRLSESGVPTFTLQKLLGHSDIRTTQEYVHPTLPPLPSVMAAKG